MSGAGSGPNASQLGETLSARASISTVSTRGIILPVSIRYLFDEEPNLSPEEQTIVTELRQRWEREKAELRAESKAEAILTVLKARGFKVSDSVRQRVLGCKDPGTLELWLTRAATATSDTEVIAA